ncbi:MAG: hypothetical protein JSS96_05450 [Bacteroidetes bacterium]|nr:hypothetical protein [Bacteroidota bacterium]
MKNRLISAMYFFVSYILSLALYTAFRQEDPVEYAVFICLIISVVFTWTASYVRLKIS